VDSCSHWWIPVLFVQIRGKLLIRFSRITNGGAYVGGIRIAFDPLPMFDVKIKPFDQIDLTNTLGVNQVVSKFVGQILGSVITEPNPLVLDIDQWDTYKPTDSAEHVVTVELKVLATNQSLEQSFVDTNWSLTYTIDPNVLGQHGLSLLCITYWINSMYDTLWCSCSDENDEQPTYGGGLVSGAACVRPESGEKQEEDLVLRGKSGKSSPGGQFHGPLCGDSVRERQPKSPYKNERQNVDTDLEREV
jgi:hypothetical protein